MSARWVLAVLACHWTAQATHLWSDEVSLLQLSSSSAGEFQQDFRLEDAEPLFRLAYGVAHDGSTRTLEEKAISLLQNLAQHRRVVGTSAEKALLKTATAAQQMFDSDRFEAEDQLETEFNSSSGHGPPFGGTWNPLHDKHISDYKTFDWVPITSGAQDTGFCWHSNGGKPLACDINSWAVGTIGVDFAKSWQEKGYANPCEQMCARAYWCSGYGWSPATSRPSKKAECILFNDGSGSCEKATGNKLWYTMHGIEPVHSAQDLRLVTGVARDDQVYTQFRMRTDMASVQYSRIGAYKCVAKYAEKQSQSWLFGSDVSFTSIDDSAKCQHSMSTSQVPAYLKECEVVPHQLAFVTPETGSNACEKLCSDLRWCSGYAYKAPALDAAANVYSKEDCSFYSKLDGGCPSNPEAWNDATKLHPAAANSMSAWSPSYAGKISTHFIPDEDTRSTGWVCVAKEYSGKLKSKAGAGPMCSAAKGGALMSLAMAITSAVGVLGCPDLTGPTTRAAVADGSGGANASRAADLLASLVAPPNVTDLLAFGGGIVENFTEGQARSAVRRYSEDTEEDAEAIARLRAGRFSDLGKCYLQQSGQSLRFLLYALGNFFGGAKYQCGLMNKAKHFCTSSALKSAGAGIFGAGMYGAPRIMQECSDNPWPVTRASCGMDFAKASIYVGRAIWKFIQLVWLSDTDTWSEKALGVTDMLASLTFITEGILRTQGPCAGEISGDPNEVKLKDGGCIATYTEVAALGLQSLAYGGTAVRYCMEGFKSGPGTP